MRRSGIADSLIALAVAAAILFAASKVVARLTGREVDPVTGANDLTCSMVFELTGWRPGFPCWWLVAGILVVFWLMLFGLSRSR